MDVIDQRDISHQGRALTVVIVPDTDARPGEFECYSPADHDAWARDEWRYVGVLIMDGAVELDALWAVEYGTLPDVPDIDTDQIVTVHPVPDMLDGLEG